MMAEYWIQLDIETDADLTAVTKAAAELAQLAGIDHHVCGVSVTRWADDDLDDVLPVDPDLAHTAD
jgi:hypothetical protein